MGNFLAFCEVLESVGRTRSTGRKSELFANYLEALQQEVTGSPVAEFAGSSASAGSSGNPAEIEKTIALACQFAGEGAFRQNRGHRAGVGSRTVALSASEFCEIDHDLVFRACRTATGSGSEAIALLLENLPASKSRQKPRPWTLREVESLFETLSSSKGRIAKEQILLQIWTEMTPLEVKYWIRIMGQGSLRIGFETRSILRALSRFSGQEYEQLRYVHMVTGSLFDTAQMAVRGELETARFELFRPLSFMLASPLSDAVSKTLEFADYVAEEKFDGIRCQVHVREHHVSLYSRDLNTITDSFPDLATWFQGKSMTPTVLDGEIVAYMDHRILPFQRLQKRLGVKNPTEKIMKEIPLLFIAYDLLYCDGKDYLNNPLEDRRNALEALCGQFGISYSRQFPVQNEDEVRTLFSEARQRGNEGVMLKKKSSPYEFGQRRQSWLKVKEPAGSLDTILLYAHAGSGKRGGTYSDFTLGISVREDERFEEEFVPIGKAYGGYTDQELRTLNQRLRTLIIDRFGPTLALRPEIVVELEFDAIQVNKRTKAGYSLRFPRFRSIRWDLSASDVDTLKDVEHLLSEQEGRVTESQIKPVSFILHEDKG